MFHRFISPKMDIFSFQFSSSIPSADTEPARTVHGEMNNRFTPIDRNGKAHAHGAIVKRHREKRGDSPNVKVENNTQRKRPDWPMCVCGTMYVCVCEHSSAVRYNAL